MMNILKNIKRPSMGQSIFWVVAIALAIGAFFFARNMTTCWTITQLPGTPPSNCGTVTAGLKGPVLDDKGTPIPSVDTLPTPVVAAPVSDLPPAWDGASRINILFIGLDYRDWVAGEGAPRSDTMILFTIDPVSKTAGML
jgi:hypothetical protein